MLILRLLDQGVDVAIIFVIVISLSFAYHEFAHAIVADRLGDPTPRQYGRITLNPLPHLSLAGFVMLLLFGFGGAYTPVRPQLLRGDWRKSHALVAVAGPAANLIMAVIFAAIYRFLLTDFVPTSNTVDFAINFAQSGVFWNLFLMAFNLVPIPPLDGFSILQGVLPREISVQLDGLRQYGILILVAALFLLPNVGFDLFGDFIFPSVQRLQTILLFGGGF
jgi:Zn-dependent protease